MCTVRLPNRRHYREISFRRMLVRFKGSGKAFYPSKKNPYPHFIRVLVQENPHSSVPSLPHPIVPGIAVKRFRKLANILPMGTKKIHENQNFFKNALFSNEEHFVPLDPKFTLFSVRRWTTSLVIKCLGWDFGQQFNSFFLFQWSP